MRKVIALLLMTLLAGCGGQPPVLQSPVQPAPQSSTQSSTQSAPLPALDSRISAASAAFGIDLLKQVYQGENSFLSPISASLVLSLTGAGAGGDTQREFWRALRLEALTAEEIHQGNQALQAVLTQPDPKVEVALANAIWHRPDVKVADAFAALAADRYGAEVDSADFGTETATRKINDWTAEATRGKIKKLLENTRPDTVMVLVNALYFKGSWSEAFDPKRTRESTFTTASGAEIQIPFMEKDAEWGHVATANRDRDNFEAVRLPYGSGRVAMYLFVPDNLDRFVEELDTRRWAEYMDAFQPRSGLVRLPKFKLEATHKLNEPMQALGLVSAFDAAQADFSGLFADGRQGVAIDLILQKTFLEVNEEGTEAAAATAVVMEESAPMPLLEVNRPFLVAIRDDETGALLFLGAVTDPQ